MDRLSTTSKLFWDIVYYFNNLISYFANLYQITPYLQPADSMVYLYEHEGISFLRFCFSKKQEHNYKYPLLQMQDELQDHLDCVSSVLPLPQYKASFGIPMGMLQIISTTEKENYIVFDIVVVDNSLAHRYVHDLRKDEFRRYPIMNLEDFE